MTVLQLLCTGWYRIIIICYFYWVADDFIRYVYCTSSQKEWGSNFSCVGSRYYYVVV